MKFIIFASAYFNGLGNYCYQNKVGSSGFTWKIYLRNFDPSKNSGSVLHKAAMWGQGVRPPVPRIGSATHPVLLP
ncbi:hypothetical protein [Coxiella endosymbiont of Ornithodoros maritimus]|uniref:hypothetical protein n=1 Tax=Coxiella endosymbiont of Ornithodoros maritimus TaxID=1656172 RepID=UPI0022652FC2|nr:hypothetical protein [Coxiella endosymbiont of Ornithodoros maritimus]